MMSSGEPNSATSRLISGAVNGSMKERVARDLRVLVSNAVSCRKGRRIVGGRVAVMAETVRRFDKVRRVMKIPHMKTGS